MKKFINSQETITDEELVGFGLAYGDIVTVDGHTVISKDLEGGRPRNYCYVWWIWS